MAPTRGYFDETNPFGEPHFGEPHFSDSFMSATVNPQNLLHATSLLAVGDLAIPSDAHSTLDYSAPDTSEWNQRLKQDLEDIGAFINDMDNSPMTTNTHSPAADAIFSQSNSPYNFVRDLSPASSPEPAAPVIKQDPEAPEGANLWDAPEAMFIPHPRETPRVTLTADKNKTRAETQINMTLTLDPLDDDVRHIKFPRRVLAKPKQYADDTRKREAEQKGAVLSMDIHLVCATTCTTEEDRATVLRRAAGIEKVPRKPDGKTVTELDKDDAAHPQNGGAVLICDGCIERERKRAGRRKKTCPREDEFAKNEKERVLMINEGEYKEFQEVEGSNRARQVEFIMRIACYCRHQQEKPHNGYRVVFTFRLGKTMLVQHISDPFYITDDHKNKEPPSNPLSVPPPMNYQIPPSNPPWMGPPMNYQIPPSNPPWMGPPMNYQIPPPMNYQIPPSNPLSMPPPMYWIRR